MKIYLDTKNSLTLTVDSYEEDGGFLFARIGTIVRKIPIDKVAYIEEDMRRPNQPQSPEPPTPNKKPEQIVPQAPVNTQTSAPMPLPSSFAAAVDRHLVTPAVGLKPPPGLVEVDRSVPIDIGTVGMPSRKQNIEVINGAGNKASDVTRLLVKVTGAANASIDILVPRNLADGELEEELVKIIFDNDELMDIISNLAYKSLNKKGHVIEIVTEFRKPNLTDPKTVIATQLSAMTANLGQGMIGNLLPNIPMKETKESK